MTIKQGGALYFLAMSPAV